jgi:hypothetical protein
LTEGKETTAAQPKHGHLLADYVYVDASIYRALQFDWRGHWLTALVDLVQRGLVRVVITEITRREVAALIRETWTDASRATKKFAVTFKQVGLIDAVEVLADEEACVAKMIAEFDRWLVRAKAWTCKYDANLVTIMDDYFGGRPPFGTGRKKAEFPDAIVVSMLRAWCAKTRASVYVISQDGDLKACCSPEGPLIHAGSVAEVVSHGIASAALHDAVTAAITQSEWFSQQIQRQAASLPAEAESGYRGGTMTDVEVEALKLENLSVDGVIVMNFDGVEMTCAVSLTGEFSVLVHVEQEPDRHREDDWDGGRRQAHWINVSVDMCASVIASLGEGGTIELTDVQLDDRSIKLPWRDIEWGIS